MTLHSERLTLTPLAREHFADMKSLMGDPGVRATYGEGRDSDEYVGGWIDRDVALRGRGIPGMHALTLSGEHDFLGVCGLLEQTVEGATDMEIAYLLRDHARGNGYATEAARFWRDRAFATLGIGRIVSLILKHNLPSIAVAERNGMRREREATFRDHPIYVYSIERPDWEAIKLHERRHYLHKTSREPLRRPGRERHDRER